MKYQEVLLLPPEERRKLAAREILAKIKDGTLEAERIAFCYPESDYISVCAVGAFQAYKLDFNIDTVIAYVASIYRSPKDYELTIYNLGFTYCEYEDLHMYFEQEMVSNNRTQNLRRVFQFIAATGRIPSVMNHTVPEGE